MYSYFPFIFSLSIFLLSSVNSKDVAIPLPLLGPSTLSSSSKPLTFRDVTIDVGLTQPGPRFKWGGPCVADIDGDGYYDVILSYHFSARLQMFFGTSNGTFEEYKGDGFLERIKDIHGVTVGPKMAMGNRLVVVSVGGKRGKDLSPLYVYEVDATRQVKDVSFKYGLGKGVARGRTVLFMNLKERESVDKLENRGGTDILAMGYLGRKEEGLKNFAYENIMGGYKLRKVKGGIQVVGRGRVEVTDLEQDGDMEVVSVRALWFYKKIGDFEYANVTEGMIDGGVGNQVGHFTTSSVAEIDFDNDGDFDLWVGRTNRTLITNRLDDGRPDDLRDLLLENMEGKEYREIGAASRVPKGVHSMGVTVGDFNNDGFVDVFVTTWLEEEDLLLENQGDGTFKAVKSLFEKKKKATVGNHAVAVDYDLDGRLDIIVGHGGIKNYPGTYMVLKNEMMNENHYLLVRVGAAPGLGVSSLHAVVKLHVGGMVMSRRIGSPGAQGGGGSWLDTLHFGLGRFETISKVVVKWINGVVRTKKWVNVDQKIEFGVV